MLGHGNPPLALKSTTWRGCPQTGVDIHAGAWTLEKNMKYNVNAHCYKECLVIAQTLFITDCILLGTGVWV
jgi:hypothetical protein